MSEIRLNTAFLLLKQINFGYMNYLPLMITNQQHCYKDNVDILFKNLSVYLLWINLYTGLVDCHIFQFQEFQFSKQVSQPTLLGDC